MSNKNQSKKPVKQKANSFLFSAIAIAVVAVAVVFFSQNDKEGNSSVVGTTDKTSSSDNTVSNDGLGVPATVNENGDVVIQIADITEKANFYDYDSNGTPMGIFAVKASDGTIRTALNTCQVCNGSPKAYFKQQEDTFQCQNCGNKYSLDMIGQERGGCNPVPIMADEKTVTDTEIIIPAEFLEDNAALFENWKQF